MYLQTIITILLSVYVSMVRSQQDTACTVSVSAPTDGANFTESQGTVAVKVRRTGYLDNGLLGSVTVTPSDPSISTDSVFTSTTQPFFLGDQANQTQVMFDIMDNDVKEDNKVFTITLNLFAGCCVVAPSSVGISIIDDDDDEHSFPPRQGLGEGNLTDHEHSFPPRQGLGEGNLTDHDTACTVSVSAPTDGANFTESNGTVVVTVRRTGYLDSGHDSLLGSVTVTSSDPSTSTDSVFTSTTQPFFLGDQANQTQVMFDIMDNDVKEDNKVFTITLNLLAGCCVGAPSSVGIIIIDDDVSA